jgi:hypothetical protein
VRSVFHVRQPNIIDFENVLAGPYSGPMKPEERDKKDSYIKHKAAIADILDVEQKTLAERDVLAPVDLCPPRYAGPYFVPPRLLRCVTVKIFNE